MKCEVDEASLLIAVSLARCSDAVGDASRDYNGNTEIRCGVFGREDAKFTRALKIQAALVSCVVLSVVVIVEVWSEDFITAIRWSSLEWQER